MDYTNILKNRLKDNANALGYNGKIRESAFIFNDLQDNFHNKSFQNIISGNHSDWQKRTQKKHTHFTQNILEMQSCNSSDALLMNIFCHPKIRLWKGVSKLLKVNMDNGIEFGWQGVGFSNELSHKTEIDMKIGNRLFEAKLTEKDFTAKPIGIVENYDGFDDVFDKTLLLKKDNEYPNYQLIRNILAAYKNECFFTLLVDESRIDLIRSLQVTQMAIKIGDLRKQIDFITWQEIASVCGKDLKNYLENKYF